MLSLLFVQVHEQISVEFSKNIIYKTLFCIIILYIIRLLFDYLTFLILKLNYCNIKNRNYNIFFKFQD